MKQRVLLVFLVLILVIIIFINIYSVSAVISREPGEKVTKINVGNSINCKDTDNGIIISNRGLVTDKNSGEKALDYCGDNGNLVEFYCKVINTDERAEEPVVPDRKDNEFDERKKLEEDNKIMSTSIVGNIIRGLFKLAPEEQVSEEGYKTKDNVDSKYIGYSEQSCPEGQRCLNGQCQKKESCYAVSIGSNFKNDYVIISNKEEDKKELGGMFGKISTTGRDAILGILDQFEKDDAKGWCPPPDSSEDLDCVIEEDPNKFITDNPIMRPVYTEPSGDMARTVQPKTITVSGEDTWTKGIPVPWPGYTKLKSYHAAGGLAFSKLWVQVSDEGEKLCKDTPGTTWNVQINDYSIKFEDAWFGAKWLAKATATATISCVPIPDKWYIEGSGSQTRTCIEAN